MIFSLDIFEDISTYCCSISLLVPVGFGQFGLCCLLEDDRGAKSLIFSHLQTNLERSSASSSSCWALRYLAKLRAAISSASSICFLYVLILSCSLEASSDMRSW